MSGYANIHRRLLGHPAFRNDGEAMCFAWLIMKAAWRPTRVRYKDRLLNLKRGQIAVSVRDFAAAMDRDRAWIERLLKRLRAETMIETQHETGVNIITVCNYGQYQADTDIGETLGETLGETGARQGSRSKRDRGETRSETVGETGQQFVTHGKERVKGRSSDSRETVGETPLETDNATGARQGRDTEQEREEENIPPHSPPQGASGKTLIPEDWVPPPVAELPPRARACAEQWPEEVYANEGEAFVCYWRSERKMKSDWRLTFANRIIDQHDRVMRRTAARNYANGGSQRNFEDIVLEEAERRQTAGAVR